MALTLLDQRRGWVAVDKPPGLSVISGRSGEGAHVRAELEAQLGQRLFVVHRLDKDTSGVLLFAKDAATHRTLSMAFEAGRIEKRYLALVTGDWAAPEQVDVPLLPARKGKMRPAAPHEGGKPASTDFRPLERFGAATWLEAFPVTGRTHQIRVHAKAAGHALLVDPKYGAAGPLAIAGAVLNRTPLHAAALRLPALPGLEAAEIRSPVPSDLEAVLEALRVNLPKA